MNRSRSIDYTRRCTSRGFALLLCGALAAWLAGCAPKPGVPAGNATAASVSASEAALAAAGRVIVACYSVPACGAVAPKPTIKAAYDAAYASVTQAQGIADAGGTPDMTASVAAMSALQALIARLPSPKAS